MSSALAGMITGATSVGEIVPGGTALYPALGEDPPPLSQVSARCWGARSPVDSRLLHVLLADDPLRACCANGTGRMYEPTLEIQNVLWI